MRAVAVVCVLLTGCFYIDPILARPRSLIIRPDTIYRGGAVLLTAQLVDPESHPGTFSWTVSACSGFANGVADQCDAPFYPPPGARAPDESPSTLSFTVPPMTRSRAKTQAIQVTLDARNDRGALAQSNEDYAVGDAPPIVELDRRSHSLAVGGPIDVIATYSDVDSSLDGIMLDWSVIAPVGSASFGFEDVPIVQDPGDPGHRRAGKRLTPTVTGSWSVQVTARDPEGVPTTHDLPLAVVADQPPCLRQWLPTVPPPGATLPISTPTVFQVPLVDDDLDPYPPISEAPKLRFAWSVLRPGAAREVQTGATGNAVVLDPAAFTPGDVVELRVEIYDRQQTGLPCDDAAATCSIRSSDSCLQRQTWRIEVR